MSHRFGIARREDSSISTIFSAPDRATVIVDRESDNFDALVSVDPDHILTDDARARLVRLIQRAMNAERIELDYTS